MKKIGWQKYEDMLESQLESPLMNMMITQAMGALQPQDEDMLEEEEEMLIDDLASGKIMLPLDEKMIENIALTSNFDCWMGHANFDLTPEVKTQLDKIDGIEILKICSRYRFFIGIGRMFSFKDVRSNIESTLSITKGDNFESKS